eukprot:s1611_g8.t1
MAQPGASVGVRPPARATQWADSCRIWFDVTMCGIVQPTEADAGWWYAVPRQTLRLGLRHFFFITVPRTFFSLGDESALNAHLTTG